MDARGQRALDAAVRHGCMVFAGFDWLAAPLAPADLLAPSVLGFLDAVTDHEIAAAGVAPDSASAALRHTVLAAVVEALVPGARPGTADLEASEFGDPAGFAAGRRAGRAYLHNFLRGDDALALERVMALRATIEAERARRRSPLALVASA